MVAPSICVNNLLLNLVEFDVMVITMASSMHSADGWLYFLYLYIYIYILYFFTCISCILYIYIFPEHLKNLMA